MEKSLINTQLLAHRTSESDENEVEIVINVTIKNSYSRTEEEVPSLGGVIMTEKGYVLGYRTSHFLLSHTE